MVVLSGVSIRASPNLDIPGVKFDSKLTFEDHVNFIVSSVSQRKCIVRLVKRIFVDTSVLLWCYFAFVLPILEWCSSVSGLAADSNTIQYYCLIVTVMLPNNDRAFSFLSARCIHWQASS